MSETPEAILAKIRGRGALKHCPDCEGTDFEYVGRSTGAALGFDESELLPSELLMNTTTYKLHIFCCNQCYRIMGFRDKE
jgi:hypothetical protein